MLPQWNCNAIRQLVNHVLMEVECSTTNIPSIKEIIQRLGLGLMPYSNLKDTEINTLAKAFGGIVPPGLLVHEPGFPCVIFYDDLQTPQQQAKILAHELGHFINQHCQASDLAENEADYFAVILMLKLNLYSLHNSIQELDEIFSSKRYHKENCTAEDLTKLKVYAKVKLAYRQYEKFLQEVI